MDRHYLAVPASLLTMLFGSWASCIKWEAGLGWRPVYRCRYDCIDAGFPIC